MEPFWWHALLARVGGHNIKNVREGTGLESYAEQSRFDCFEKGVKIMLEEAADGVADTRKDAPAKKAS